MAQQRTWEIWTLLVLAIIAGIVNLVDAARYMGWVSIATLGPLNFYLNNANWFGALLAVLVAIIWFAVAKWIYDLNEQGWLFVVVVAIFNLAFLLLAWLGNSTWTAVSIGVIVNAVMLILAILPSTKKAFARG